MNKKAMFFTILAIALMSLFLISYTFYSVVQGRKSIDKRIETMNNFLFSIEQDLQREVYIIGFRTLFSAEDYITKKGQYITDINSFFREAFFNGTVDGNSSEILIGVTYKDIVESVNEKSKRLNINLNLTNPEILITQEDPWHVALILSLNLTMKDMAELASWNKKENIKSLIKIEGFEDPLYVINTGGQIINKINKTIYEPIDISNLLAHTQSSYYIESTTAPSFLNRLQGITSNSSSGIESLVYLPKLSSQGIAIKDKSCVDYIYFSSDNPSAYSVAGMPSWFKLDSPHLNVYGIS